MAYDNVILRGVAMRIVMAVLMFGVLSVRQTSATNGLRHSRRCRLAIGLSTG